MIYHIKHNAGSMNALITSVSGDTTFIGSAVLFMLLMISSCRKEYSYERDCGVVVRKDILRNDVKVIFVKYNEVSDPYIITVSDSIYEHKSVNDIFCK